MSRPALPLELVDMIFTWARLASEPQKESADFKTLAASACVCKAWRASAQALLFRDIPISLCHQQRSFLIRTLSDRPDLGRHIRSFGMEITSPPVPWGLSATSNVSSKRYRRMVTDFIKILNHTPNLSRLSIDIDGEFDRADIRKLQSIRLNHIQILNWEGRPTSSALYQFLALWPSIRHLRVDSLDLDPLPNDHRPLSLRSLCVRDEPSECFMTWLLPTPTCDQDPLRELHLESGVPSYEALKNIQRLFGRFDLSQTISFCQLPRIPLHLPRSVQQVRFHANYPRQLDLPKLNGSHIGASAEVDECKNAIEAGHLIRALKELPNLFIVGATCEIQKRSEHL
ncbi:hypothetical protein BGW80DRAFT_1457179 [Lactifluus volemus]|nr:hypothetical protein BGW80DRAFT_1457179 [Lactifluus volemus]